MTRLWTLSPSRPARRGVRYPKVKKFEGGGGKRAVVDTKGYTDRRRVDRLRGDRLGDRKIGNGIGNGRLGHPGETDEVASLGNLDGLTCEPTEREDLRDPEALDLGPVPREGVD